MQKTTTYHHGNLYQALLEAAFTAARQNGPKAIGLRKLAREVGVTSAAVYRHFPSQQALVTAVQGRILTELAAHMNEALGRAKPQQNPLASAFDEVRLICQAYLTFALNEPELFRTSWTKDKTMPDFIPLTEREDEPLQILMRTLKKLSAAGYIDAGDEEHAAITLWSAVHGLAELLLSGPLRNTPAAKREAITAWTIEAALRGIATPSLSGKS